MPLSTSAFTGAVAPPLLQATPHTATKIIAITSDNRGLRKGVISQPLHVIRFTLATNDLKILNSCEYSNGLQPRARPTSTALSRPGDAAVFATSPMTLSQRPGGPQTLGEFPPLKALSWEGLGFRSAMDGLLLSQTRSRPTKRR